MSDQLVWIEKFGDGYCLGGVVGMVGWLDGGSCGAFAFVMDMLDDGKNDI